MLNGSMIHINLIAVSSAKTISLLLVPLNYVWVLWQTCDVWIEMQLCFIFLNNREGFPLLPHSLFFSWFFHLDLVEALGL